jgi:hypothetical protein
MPPHSCPRHETTNTNTNKRGVKMIVAHTVCLSACLPVCLPACRQAFVSCEDTGEGAGCRTVGDVTAEAAASMEGLFYSFGVDVWNAGHAHMCRLWILVARRSGRVLTGIPLCDACSCLEICQRGVPG